MNKDPKQQPKNQNEAKTLLRPTASAN